MGSPPWTGVIPINPHDVTCPVDDCEAPAERVCPIPGPCSSVATTGILVCTGHRDVITRIIGSKRGGIIISRREGYTTTVRLTPPPPVTRREWKRVRADLIAILHDLHPTTKGH